MRFISIITWLWLNLSSLALSSPLRPRSRPLAQLALQKVLDDAAPILGVYEPGIKNGTANWMGSYPDWTPIVHMNLPGVHDAATWNYTQATQDALRHVTDLNGVTLDRPETFRCQDSPLISMLNGGIRVFDLRFAFDATNSSLVFYHGPALQSETTSIEDLLFGFYTWLDDHPSEALFTSFQYEGSTKKYAANNGKVQLKLFNTLTSVSAQNYFVQTKGELGTLGQARGKITLIRRFDLDQLPPSYEQALPGLHFPPALWTDNRPSISLRYNIEKNLTAYIEDYYEPSAHKDSAASYLIDLKYNVTASHLIKATTQNPDSLFWTWASSRSNDNVPPLFPRIMATGNGSDFTPLGGVNHRLLPLLREVKGKRIGIVMFDFFELPGDLLATLLGL